MISQYHRLLHCPAGSRESVREEIRQGAADEPAVDPSAATPLGAAVVRSLERDRFDPELRPKSTVVYESRGARIRGVEMRNAEGEVVNVLSRGSRYTYSFEVTFDRDCSAVRFGMMCKDVVGVDLGGLASHPKGDALPHIAAGSRVQVRIPFVARLAPGTYFANAGVMGLVDSEEMFLHRILDACMFRVALEADCLVTGSIDLSSEEAIHLEAAGPPAVELTQVQLTDD